MLFGKPIDRIDVTDLQKLIDDGVLEKKGLDYKRQFTGNSDGDKKELLYDLTSFANAGGGYLIFGMRETDGIPVEIAGIDNVAVDGEKLRIESILREGVEPRIPGITIHPVSVSEGKSVLIVHAPRSWAAPHMVKFKGSSKFYSRNSAGKYQLDVNEIRASFLLSATLADKMKNFRLERLGKVVANELPFEMPDNPKVVMHIVPFSAFNTLESHELYVPENILESAPFCYGNLTHRINFDGYMVHTPQGNDGKVITYSQLFSNGNMEIVDARMLSDNVIPCNKFEGELIKSVQRYFRLYIKMEVAPPILIMLSLLNVKGRNMPNSFYSEDGEPIDRDNLIIPEIFVEDFNIEADILMKPAFDAIWNAAGVKESKGYNESGRWVGMR